MIGWCVGIVGDVCMSQCDVNYEWMCVLGNIGFLRCVLRGGLVVLIVDTQPQSCDESQTVC